MVGWLNSCQPLPVILRRPPEEGRKWTEELIDEREKMENRGGAR